LTKIHIIVLLLIYHHQYFTDIDCIDDTLFKKLILKELLKIFYKN
jgi:hypothetical protein